jgi:hypothetical protein
MGSSQPEEKAKERYACKGIGIITRRAAMADFSGDC